MKLIWKLLRQHISHGQLLGFFLANLFGMFIVLLSLQFYSDLSPALTQDDGLFGNDYLIVSKRVGALGAGDTNFTDSEVQQLSSQPFTKSVGAFVASSYKVYCRLGMQGVQYGTDMFFESVPDHYVDVKGSSWKWEEGEVVPIILPRNYLAIYNFGFAQSRSLPKMGEGIASMMQLQLVLSGNGMKEMHDGRIVGFSSRLNTILVPEEFMQWSNARYASESTPQTSRLILEVKNPTDERIAQYMKSQGYEIADDKLEAGRTMFFLKVCSGIIMLVGLLISALSFYILMLSVFLLLEKNVDKLRNLLLIGYSPSVVALPYQMLTLCLNVACLVLVVLALLWVRDTYLNYLWAMFPQMQEGSILPTILLGLALLLLVSAINIITIRRKVISIWKNS